MCIKRDLAAYHIAGKFGEDLNFPAIRYMITCSYANNDIHVDDILGSLSKWSLSLSLLRV